MLYSFSLQLLFSDVLVAALLTQDKKEFCTCVEGYSVLMLQWQMLICIELCWMDANVQAGVQFLGGTSKT